MGIRIVALNKSLLPGIYCSEFHMRVLFKPQCHPGSENQRKLWDCFYNSPLGFWKDKKVQVLACLSRKQLHHSFFESPDYQVQLCVFVCFFSGLAGILIKSSCDVAPHHCAVPLAQRKLSVWAAVPLSRSNKQRGHEIRVLHSQESLGRFITRVS